MTRDSVEAVIARVRPFLQADGGDIEVVDVDTRTVGIRLTGVCAHCPSAHLTLQMGIESVLRHEVPGFESLQLV